MFGGWADVFQIPIFINTPTLCAKLKHAFPNYMDEIEIMHSSDKTLKLTDRRITLLDGNTNQEILLKDFIKCAIIKKPFGKYNKLALIFAILTIFCLLGMVNDNALTIANLNSKYYLLTLLFNSLYALPFILCLILLVVSALFYYFTLTYYLQIDGHYNSITVLLKNRRPRSIKQFIQKIEFHAKEIQKVRL